MEPTSQLCQTTEIYIIGLHGLIQLSISYQYGCSPLEVLSLLDEYSIDLNIKTSHDYREPCLASDFMTI